MVSVTIADQWVTASTDSTYTQSVQSQSTVSTTTNYAGAAKRTARVGCPSVSGQRNQRTFRPFCPRPIYLFRVWGKVPEERNLILEIDDSAQCSVVHSAKASSMRPAVSTEHRLRLVTDRQTDRQTDRHRATAYLPTSLPQSVARPKTEYYYYSRLTASFPGQPG